MRYFVYALNHTYTDDTQTDSKRLGYFNDLKDLEEVKEKAVTLPSFKLFPESFVVQKYILDKINWKDGFTEAIGELGRDYLEHGDEVDENILSIKELGSVSIFSLSHMYTIHTYLDDERYIGIFSSLKNAENAIDELKDKPGFKDFSDDFNLCEVELNLMHWKKGF